MHARLSKTFWADTINTLVYLINKGPSTLLDYRTPEEFWSDEKVNLCFLKVLGCLSYIHIDFANKAKLDPKSKSVLLLAMVILSLVIISGMIKIRRLSRA